MDMVISALVWGIKQVTGATVNKVVDSGLQKLKHIILQKSGNNPDIAEALQRLEKNPSQSRQDSLREDIEAIGLKEDKDILTAAESLLSTTAEGKQILHTQQTLHLEKGAKGVAVAGNNNNVSIG